MDNGKKTKLYTVTDDGTFLFHHDREYVMNVLDERYSIARGLLPFWAKRKYEDAFEGGYHGGYQDGYNDAYNYLIKELGMSNDTKNKVEKIQFLKKTLKEKFSDIK